MFKLRRPICLRLSEAVVNRRNLLWDQNATEILILKYSCSIWFRVSSKPVVYVHNYMWSWMADLKYQNGVWVLVGMHPVTPCLRPVSAYKIVRY